ncbi:MAG: GNAT family N-acetyltransferase [Dehalococcoidia bacterium]
MALITPSEHILRDGRTLTVRSVAPDEAPELIAYLNAISTESEFLGFSPGELTMTIEEERQFIERCGASPGAIAMAGFVDDSIVASLTFLVGFKSRTRHLGELGMSVRQAFWGLGVGTAMAGTFIEWAHQEPSVTKVNLRVRTDNQRALAIYRRYGFSVEGTLRRDICVDGRYFDHYAMGLLVD